MQLLSRAGWPVVLVCRKRDAFHCSAHMLLCVGMPPTLLEFLVELCSCITACAWRLWWMQGQLWYVGNLPWACVAAGIRLVFCRAARI